MNQPGTFASGIFGHGMGSFGEYRSARRGSKRAVRGIGTMPQPGSYHDGALGAVQLRPRQSGSYQDGSLGAIQLRPQPGSYHDGALGDAYRDGVLGGAYSDGILGQTPPYVQAATAAANAARIQQEKRELARARGGTGMEKKKRTGSSFTDMFRAGCIKACSSDACRASCIERYAVSGLGAVTAQEAKNCQISCKTQFPGFSNRIAGQKCYKTCLNQHVSGLGMFENVPKWALYAGGAAVLGAGYFLFFKKKR